MKYKKEKHPLGFYQAKPSPSQNELNEFYSKKYYQECKSKSYSHQYSSEEMQYITQKPIITHNIWKSVNGDTKGTILDIGSGEGFFVRHFHDAGWKIEACDFSSYGIEQHNSELLKHFTKGDIYTILDEKIKQKSKFHLINLSNVLEHVIDPLTLLTEVRKLMDKDSILRIEVPNDFSGFQEMLVERGFTKDHWFLPPEHLNYFTFKSLNNVLTNLGYSVVKMIADFPIETFLLNENSNYVHHKERGKQAHLARMLTANFLMKQDVDSYIAYLGSAADLEYGRSIVAFVRK